MPVAGDELSVRRQIVVESMREWHASVRAAIDIACYVRAATNGKAVKSARSHLKNEVSRPAVRDFIDWAKAHARRSGCGTRGLRAMLWHRVNQERSTRDQMR